MDVVGFSSALRLDWHRILAKGQRLRAIQPARVAPRGERALGLDLGRNGTAGNTRRRVLRQGGGLGEGEREKTCGGASNPRLHDDRSTSHRSEPPEPGEHPPLYTRLWRMSFEIVTPPGFRPRAGADRLPDPDGLKIDATFPRVLASLDHVPEWRNWQTRGTQNPVRFTPSVGSTPTSGTNTATS